MTDKTIREEISFCRICTGGCGVRLRIEGDKILSIRGDPDNPMTKGYACFKGLASAEAHHGSPRLLRPLKRMPDGNYRQIGLDEALDEISERLAVLIDEFGPESVALFCGNGAYTNATGHAMQAAFLKAIGSTQYFTSMTLDQSAKYVAAGRLGSWGGGFHSLEQMDVLLLFGVNTLLSHSMFGWLSTDPIKRLKMAKQGGLKMIVIDPRSTETARQADLALQPYPGQDAAIAGGLIRIIIDEGWHDERFCVNYVGAAGMAALREAVDPLTEEHVAERAGLAAGQLRAVAEMFARDGRHGIAYAATGVNMAPYSNLAQHMVELLNVVCGRFLRAGDQVQRRNILARPRPAVARVYPPTRSWAAHGPSRIRGTRMLFGERPSGTLTDEIFTPGSEQIKALIVDGGDPMTSFPDQRRTYQAFQKIPLLIAIDPWPSQTTKLAHFVLPSTMQYERADLPASTQGISIWPGAWGNLPELRFASPLAPTWPTTGISIGASASASATHQLPRQTPRHGGTTIDRRPARDDARRRRCEHRAAQKLSPRQRLWL